MTNRWAIFKAGETTCDNIIVCDDPSFFEHPERKKAYRAVNLREGEHCEFGWAETGSDELRFIPLDEARIVAVFSDPTLQDIALALREMIRTEAEEPEVEDPEVDADDPE